MEEKDRYELKIYAGCEYYSITDTKEKQQITIENTINLLNQQDKRIKELEEENKDLKYWENMFRKVSKEEDNAISKVNKSLSKPMPLIDDYDKWADYTIEQIKQSQKQLAIEELEFVLKNFRNRPAYFDVARQELCLSDQDKQFIDFINNQIKELGGEKNE